MLFSRLLWRLRAGRRARVHHLFHFLARLEGNDALGWDLHFVAGTGISCLSSLALLDLEDAEVSQLNTTLLGQGFYHGVKRPLNDLLDVLLRETEVIGNNADYFLLGHEFLLCANEALESSAYDERPYPVNGYIHSDETKI